MKPKYIYAIAVLFPLFGCQNIETIFPPAHKVLVVGDTLVYEGMITGEAVLEAMRVVNESDTPVKKLKITSSGGNMAVGIEFGYFIKQHNLDVEVSELCFSSCANYVLSAAKSVVINTNSLIGWHGGSNQSDELWDLSVPKEDRQEFMIYLNRLRMKEKVFFNYVGVDQEITSYGQTLENNCQTLQKTDGWYYSTEDLHRMGIENFTVKGSGLLNEIEYKDDGGKIDTTGFKGRKVTSCLQENVFDT
ncbi:hypothetical protein VISI1226_22225 [Vibrio sinaloensis DSM 21326]|uniref:Uncharacterized protein n=1 Tax=Vibrio sinaloensis DSM 21326 TaxID=945550 RepID=E8M6L5_PHOS4|nr:hypothetical protein [Vibrio sinaloensis]EGA70333.1 hypothetical protein VISI1226_22225 [Vibrio sinaloensis DSM 21326]